MSPAAQYTIALLIALTVALVEWEAEKFALRIARPKGLSSDADVLSFDLVMGPSPSPGLGLSVVGVAVGIAVRVTSPDLVNFFPAPARAFGLINWVDFAIVLSLLCSFINFALLIRIFLLEGSTNRRKGVLTDWRNRHKNVEKLRESLSEADALGLRVINAGIGAVGAFAPVMALLRFS